MRSLPKYLVIYIILPAALGSGVHSACNRNEYQKQLKMFLKNRARPTCKTDNLTAICEPSESSGALNILQPCRPSQSVTEIALLYGDSVLPVRYELDCKYYYK
jgi:hypothetical protein